MEQILPFARRYTNADNFVIFMFANNLFRASVMKRIRTFQSFDIKHYFVISLDAPLHKHLGRRGVPSLLMPLRVPKDDNEARARLWIFRMRVFVHLLKGGISFLHIDADSYWVKNPLPFVQKQLKEFDVIYAHGSYFPLEVFSKWRFVVCMGFLAINANPKTVKLYQAILQRTKEVNDDQRAQNQTLQKMDVQWACEHPYDIQCRSYSISVCKEVRKGYIPRLDLEVCILPHHLFPRVWTPTLRPSEIIMHNYLDEANDPELFNAHHRTRPRRRRVTKHDGGLGAGTFVFSRPRVSFRSLRSFHSYHGLRLLPRGRLPFILRLRS